MFQHMAINISNDWMEEDESTQIDFKFLERKHNTDGYREGINAGKEYISQQAFNDGFTASIIFYEKISKYRGCLSALLLHLMTSKSCPTEILRRIEDLLIQFENMETSDTILKALTNKRLQDAELELKHGTKNVVTDSSKNITNEDLMDLGDLMRNTETFKDNVDNDQSCVSCNCDTESNKKMANDGIDEKISMNSNSKISDGCIHGQDPVSCQMSADSSWVTNNEFNRLKMEINSLLMQLHPYLGEFTAKQIAANIAP